jgi:hypothetical protein
VSSTAHQSSGFRNEKTGLDLDYFERESPVTDRGGRTDNPNWPTCCLRKNPNVIDAAGLGYTTITMHPGVVDTDLGRNLVGIDNYEKLKSGKGSFVQKRLPVS